MSDDSIGLAVLEHLGPHALAGKEMSLLEAFELGWKAALSQKVSASIADKIDKFNSRQSDSEHVASSSSSIDTSSRVK